MSNRSRAFHRASKQTITEDEINALCATNGNKGVDHSEDNKRAWKSVKTSRSDIFDEESVSEIKSIKEKESMKNGRV